MSEPVIIGRFGKSFGVRGWIKINSLTSPPENILEFKTLLIKKNNQWQKIKIEAGKKHSGSIVAKINDCETPEAAKIYTNIEIAVWREELPKLGNNEYYWSDLIGLKVTNKEGQVLGIIIDLMATGSNDVLIVMGERKRLIPYTSHVVLKIDLDAKIINVDWEKDF